MRECVVGVRLRSPPGGDDLFPCGDLNTVMTRTNLAELGMVEALVKYFYRCIVTVEGI